MDPGARLAKKREQARRLRDVPPETTLEMCFGQSDFLRRLSEAASHAYP